ncbi:MAG: T9SS type A sorting domain-containing protein, partial [Chlorobiales bacterium]|nr:T9SS type A sorting domain-containing protein [Chlorobiales bacterium]
GSFGWSVSTSGDVNGDGYSDVIVGAYGSNNAYVYHGSGSGVSTTANTTLSGSGSFGWSVSTSGDVNGDGYSDVIVGAYGSNSTYVYYGSGSGVSATGYTVLSGSGNFGYSVGTAGDVNGDGYSDVIVGAPYYDNGQIDEGASFVYYGGAKDISLSASTIVPGGAVDNQLGWKVGTAGDVNGDGYSDVIVSTYFHNVVYVCYGSASGVSTTPSWTASGIASFGWAAGTAGDVNGDGYSDIIIGEYEAGRAYVYYGSASGLLPTPSWTITAGSKFGWGAGTAGDVNGDGYSDVIVGARDYNSWGAALIYHGSPGGLSSTPATIIYGPAQTGYTPDSDGEVTSWFGLPVGCAGDVNKDGFDDVFVGAERYDHTASGPINEGAAYVYYGSQTGVQTTGYWMTHPTSLAYNYYGIGLGAAGDVNGDGYADLVVSAYRYPNNSAGTGVKKGKLYLYLGSTLGLSQTPESWSPEGSAGSDDFLGYGVGMAGDLNGDGYSDIIAGARQYSNGEFYEGVAYIYYGSATGPSSTPLIIESNKVFTEFGVSVGMAGDVNGDGFADAVVGAWGYDATYNEGAMYVFYGNAGGGLTVQPRQYRPDFSRDIVPALKTRSINNVGLSVRGRSIQGRIPMKAQFEVKRLGTAFNGSGLTETSFTDTQGSGVLHQTIVGGLSARAMYKWRSRLVYNPALAMGLLHSHWYYPPLSFGPTLSAFQVSNDDISLPVELTSFTGTLTENGVRLNWITETETDNLGFILLRNGTQIASYLSNSQLKGQGTTASQTQYAFFDASIEVGKEYTYTLRSVDLNGTAHEYDRVVRVGNPDKYELDQNYPNPFNPSTTIRFSMKETGKATLTVYDLLGRAVKRVTIDAVKGGNQYEFNGSRLASGVYFYRLIADAFSSTRKMMLVK